jgi:ferredoxin/flavodoxin---NADP+ reductase
MLRVAVIGSGPAGLYTAEALVKQAAALPVPVRVRVDVLDRLPTPYGLVRYGVAPDHKSIKSVATYLRRVLEHPDVEFHGGVHLGRDVTREDLLGAYDAVVYATGAMRDARLGIPGEDLPGSYAATDFVNWYCGHPDIASDAFTLDAESIAVIGVGNVAVDVARILARDPAELHETDIPEPVMAALRSSRVREVNVIGRRGPAQAKFTTKELRELGDLPGVSVSVAPGELDLDIADPSGASAALAAADRRVRGNLVAMRGWAAGPALAATAAAASPARHLRLRFWLRPVEITGTERVQALTVERTRMTSDGAIEGTGQLETIDAQMVLRSVGYRSVPLDGVPFDDRTHTVPSNCGRVLDADGKALPGEYVAGWLKRGPTGVIGTNKGDAAQTVQALLADLAGGPDVGVEALPRPGLLRMPGEEGAGPDDSLDRSPLPAVLAARGVQAVSYADWLRIEAAEGDLARSLGRGERVKLASLEAIRAVFPGDTVFRGDGDAGGGGLQVLADRDRGATQLLDGPLAAAQRVELGQRDRAREAVHPRGARLGALSVGVAQPLGRLGGRERAHLDLRQAPARPGHGRVQPVQVLVGGDRDQDLPALAEDPVGEVEQPGQRLPSGLLGIAADQLVAVLQQQQPPARIVVIIAHDHVQQVARVGEQPLRVEHAVGLAPAPPLPGEGAQQGGLAGARRAVQEQQPAVHRVAGHGHEAGELGAHGGGIVRPDTVPGGGVHQAGRPGRPPPGRLVPEADGHDVGRNAPLRLGVLGRAGEHLAGQFRRLGGDADVRVAVLPAHDANRPARPGGQDALRAGVPGGAQDRRLGREQGSLGAHLAQAGRAGVRLGARRERSQREGVDEVQRRVGVIDLHYVGQ